MEKKMLPRLSYPVTERRLKPIYDSLDNGNNKKALQDAEKVLKKQPTLSSAKVLKCLALIRLGRETDCIEQLESLKDECPTHESTLQLMTACYREMHKPRSICELFENANKKEPGNEDILNSLFTSYVRVADYKKQQHTALLLYKLKPKNQYYFWAVISILLQTVNDISDIAEFFSVPIYNPHICSKTRPYQYIYLPERSPVKDNIKEIHVKLAERMVEKFFAENKIVTEHEFLVYITILEMQDKYEDALNNLDTQLAGTLLEFSTMFNLKLYLLARLKRWKSVYNLTRDVLINGFDSWNYYLYYIDAAYELENETKDNSQFICARNFLDSLCDQSKGLKKRGALLASLELCTRFSKAEGALPYLVEYFKEFGSKESCIHDLRPYVRLLSPKNCVEFLELIWEPVESSTSKSLMNYHICNHEFCRILGIKDICCGTKDKRRYVFSIIQCYVNSLKFNTDLPPTETRSSDRYALLAVHILYELWVETYISNYLYEAIVLCHYALSYSPSNSQFKTLLVKFYHLFGCAEGAHNAYLSLDVKHMQLDTLGYLHIFPLISSGAYSVANSVMANTLKFFSNNLKEGADYITFAYKYEAITKIPIFIEIKEKINNSTHYHQISVEKMLLQIFLTETYNSALQAVNELDVISQINNIQWDKLQDNRDFSVLWNFDPDPQFLDGNEILLTYNHDIVYLRLRSLLLRITVTAIYFGCSDTDNMNETDETNGFDESAEINKGSSYSMNRTILINLANALEEVLDHLKINEPKPYPKKPSIASPPKSRLFLILNESYFEIVVNVLRFLLCLAPGKDSNEEDCKYRLGAIMVLWEQFTTSFPVRSIYADQRNELLQLCSLYVELASFSCIIISVCDSLLKKLKRCIAKKSKKKKDAVPRISDCSFELEWRSNMIIKFAVFLTDTIKNVETMLCAEEKMLKNETVKYGEIFITSNIDLQEEANKFESMDALANGNLINSHISSVNKMMSLLKVKLKLLESIKP